MTEKILSIDDFECKLRDNWGFEKCYAGYEVRTSEQSILLLIDDEPSCCEQWGYFMSEDNLADFVGAEFLGLKITDTALKSFADDYYKEALEWDGDVMFVDINTDRGVLQFVAYNAHNGYYGHTAKVISRDLNHEEVL